MKTLTCYFCGEREEVSTFEQDDISMFFCDDCQQWQCDTEGCACECLKQTWGDVSLFDSVVDAGCSPQEILDMGLKALTEQILNLVNSNPHDFPLLSQRYHGQGVISDRTVQSIAEEIFEEEKRRVENDTE